MQARHLVWLALAACVWAADPPEPPLQATPEQMAWFTAARFGLFIHWGPVCLKGTEISWSRGKQVPTDVYDNLYKEFNPVKFDAKAWVKLAQDAGMKYLVFTCKHHDGFCEFDTALGDYKITNGPFKRDIVKELADACHAAGLKLGFYYSPPDWHHPDFKTANHARYLEYFHGQMRELCTNYGKVDLIWFDGLGGSSAFYGAEKLVRLIRGLQPGIIINNRVGLPADWDTPEQRIGGFQNTRPWETCMTIAQQWSWRPNDRTKSLAECLQTLVRCAGGDGNLLFNVGPLPSGEIEPLQVERLRAMGDWLKRHGDAIYNTRGGPYKPTTMGACTHRGDKVWVHVFKWQADSLALPALPGRRVLAAKLLGGGPLPVAELDGRLHLTVPADQRDPIDTIIELTLDGPAADVPPLSATGAAASLAAGAKAAASNTYQQQVGQYGPAKALDGDEDTRWATDGGTRAATLTIDFGKVVSVARVVLDEPAEYLRVRRFALEIPDGDGWRAVVTGTTLGPHKELKFDAVQTRQLRLNILEATDGPTLNEVEVYPR